MNNQCVFCQTPDNLTVTMQVTTSIGVNTVYVCAEHEDQASPKRVRELAEKRIVMLQEFEKQAKELGFTLTPIGGVIAAASPIEPQQVDIPKPTSTTTTASSVKKTILPPRKARDIDTPSVAGDVNLGKFASYDTTRSVIAKDGTSVKAPGIFDHEEQVIKGRGGAEVVIPKKIVSEAGTTEINIVNTGGDKALQDRFKGMQVASAGARTSNEAQRAFLSGGYMAKECTLCGGAGITKINNQTCKKCNGVGTV
jgi:hypothetical protein